MELLFTFLYFIKFVWSLIFYWSLFLIFFWMTWLFSNFSCFGFRSYNLNVNNSIMCYIILLSYNVVLCYVDWYQHLPVFLDPFLYPLSNLLVNLIEFYVLQIFSWVFYYLKIFRHLFCQLVRELEAVKYLLLTLSLAFLLMAVPKKMARNFKFFVMNFAW